MYITAGETVERNIIGTVLIPMAGKSKRFSDVGIKQHKTTLELNNKSIFYHQVKNISQIFPEAKIVTISNVSHNIKDFLLCELTDLEVKEFELIEVNDTNGTAETISNYSLNVNSSVLIIPCDVILTKKALLSITFAKSGALVTTEKKHGWANVLLRNQKYIEKISKTLPYEKYSFLGVAFIKKYSRFLESFYVIKGNSEFENNEITLEAVLSHLALSEKLSVISINENDFVMVGTPDEYSEARARGDKI